MNRGTRKHIPFFIFEPVKSKTMRIRDKSRDDRLFNPTMEHDRRYVAELYADTEGVYDFIRRKHRDGTIYEFTYLDVYRLIAREMGYGTPE